MSANRKKPISITLAAAVIICIITFILGFVISSFAFLDSRLESANEKIADLNSTISEKNAQIKSLNETIDQKDENNIILGEKIQEHMSTIDELNAEIANLRDDVDTISEAAINGTYSEGGGFIISFSALSLSQQLIILMVLFVIIIFIISITCGIIASKSSSKKIKRRKTEELPAPESEPLGEAEVSEEEPISHTDEAEASIQELSQEEKGEEETISQPAEDHKASIPSVVTRAIDLLYHNNLEDSISELGGFKFGITNFDEILSDKRKPKSFGNSDNGDFAAFMSHEQRKLYIIPANMILSDSTVSLRGVTDLFSVINEAGSVITYGSIKIKEVVSPAVFACGENGWFVESKGEIISLGTRTI